MLARLFFKPDSPTAMFSFSKQQTIVFFLNNKLKSRLFGAFPAIGKRWFIQFLLLLLLSLYDKIYTPDLSRGTLKKKKKKKS
jgi:hypothetical protein